MIKKLQELNLKEVCKKTQIEMDFFNALIEKDFKKLSRFNVKGFLKILEREYQLDPTQVLEEYQAYLDEHSQENTPQVNVAPKIDVYSKDSSNTILIVIASFIVLIAIGWVIYQYDLLQVFLEDKGQESTNSSVVIDIIDEAQTHIKNIAIDEENNTTKEDIEENIEKKDDTTIKTIPIEAETNETTSETSTTIQNIDIAEDNQTKEQVTINDETSENNNLSEPAKKNEIIFHTDGKVWVGFINLNTGEKTTMVTDNNFSADSQVDQLILTGATTITLIDEKGKEQKFPSGISKRFLIKDGQIKSIDLKEFMKLNKGREW